MDVQVGQVWRKSSHENVRVDSVEGETVCATLSDLRVGTTAVWVRSLSAFRDLELISGPGADGAEDVSEDELAESSDGQTGS